MADIDQLVAGLKARLKTNQASAAEPLWRDLHDRLGSDWSAVLDGLRSRHGDAWAGDVAERRAAELGPVREAPGDTSLGIVGLTGGVGGRLLDTFSHPLDEEATDAPEQELDARAEAFRWLARSLPLDAAAVRCAVALAGRDTGAARQSLEALPAEHPDRPLLQALAAGVTHRPRALARALDALPDTEAARVEAAFSSSSPVEDPIAWALGAPLHEWVAARVDEGAPEEPAGP